MTTPADGWIIVDTVEELFEDDTMTRAYLEGRLAYLFLLNDAWYSNLFLYAINFRDFRGNMSSRKSDARDKVDSLKVCFM